MLSIIPYRVDYGTSIFRIFFDLDPGRIRIMIRRSVRTVSRWYPARDTAGNSPARDAPPEWPPPHPVPRGRRYNCLSSEVRVEWAAAPRAVQIGPGGALRRCASQCQQTVFYRTSRHGTAGRPPVPDEALWACVF